MWVKVCGNTAVATAMVAVEAGADALGFIMAPGTPRSLTPAQAREIVRALPSSIELVGVFVDRPAVEVAAVAAAVGFTAVQLHGAERWADYSDLTLPAFRGLRLASPADAVGVDWPPGSILLVDSHHASLPGGTGTAFPWSWASDLAMHHRLVVSGGLSADNVGEAIQALAPWGCDASSRLESSPGVKDPARVRAYVAAARRAESEVEGAA